MSESTSEIPEKCKAGLAVMNAGKPLAALNGDASSLLTRLKEGESVQQIADSFGITDVVVYGFLLRHAPSEWQEISAGKSLARLEKASTALDTADNAITISRARESARLAQWDLERSSRKLYGDNKQEIGGVSIQVLIQREGEAQTSVIEHGGNAA